MHANADDSWPTHSGRGRRSGQVRNLADAVRTAKDAAAALGCEPAAIANSLIFMAGATRHAEPVLILTSGGHKVDTAHVATLLGVGKLGRATPDQVRAATGQPIGGVAPVGHPQPVRTLVDVALQPFPVVWAAGGIPHAVFPTSYEELLRITGGEPIAVTADGRDHEAENDGTARRQIAGGRSWTLLRRPGSPRPTGRGCRRGLPTRVALRLRLAAAPASAASRPRVRLGLPTMPVVGRWVAWRKRS